MDRFCRTCGGALRPGDRFCGACGTRVADGVGAVERDAARERFAATFASPNDPALPTDDPARQRFRDTFAQRSSAPQGQASATSEPTSGGAVSIAISVVTLIGAIVLAPIGLAVLFLGGVVAAAIGLSFVGNGGTRTADQQMAVAGTVIGAGEAIIGLLAALA